MADNMRFTPDRIAVKLGETVRFVAKNNGKQLHEFVIGTKAENAKHAELMLKFPNMEHDEPYMAHVAPGKSGQIVWTFNRAGENQVALPDAPGAAGGHGRHDRGHGCHWPYCTSDAMIGQGRSPPSMLTLGDQMLKVLRMRVRSSIFLSICASRSDAIRWIVPRWSCRPPAATAR